MARSKENDNKTSQLRKVRTLLPWLWQTWYGYRTQAITNTVIGFLIVVLDLVFVWVTKTTIDIATGVNHTTSLNRALFILGCVILGQIALGIASRWVKSILGVRAQNKMKRQLFERLLMCKWIDVRKYHTGDLLNRIERDVNSIITLLTEQLPSLFNTFMQFCGAFILLFIMNRTLALITVMVIPVFVLAGNLYVKRMRHISHKVRTSESRIQSIIQESLQHTLVLKTLTKGHIQINRLKQVQDTLHGQVVSRTKYSIVSSGVINVGFALGYFIAFMWGVKGLQAETITYGALIAFIQLVGQIQIPVRTLTKFIPVFIGAFTASERLMELEDIPHEEKLTPQPVKGNVGIRIENLDYHYPDSRKMILQDLGIDVKPGSKIAIMGETGAGKTTFIRLLLSVLSPVKGSITLYNENGKNLIVDSSTRCNFTYVPQGNTLLSGTIRENLRLANPNATEKEMKEALHLACANFIEQMPDGLDTHLGEIGDGLSEGQAQRISIARALLRNAPIMIFDEATSALDSDTEEDVIKNIIDNYTERTLIFVTHRPTVLKYCDETINM